MANVMEVTHALAGGWVGACAGVCSGYVGVSEWVTVWTWSYVSVSARWLSACAVV